MKNIKILIYVHVYLERFENITFYYTMYLKEENLFTYSYVKLNQAHFEKCIG